jgi:hypothetical protein
MKYVFSFLALIIGTLNFGYAWVAPVETFWFTLMVAFMIFASSFGQFAFSKPGEESAVVVLQLASMGFLFFGLCNIAMIA